MVTQKLSREEQLEAYLTAWQQGDSKAFDKLATALMPDVFIPMIEGLLVDWHHNHGITPAMLLEKTCLAMRGDRAARRLNLVSFISFFRVSAKEKLFNHLQASNRTPGLRVGFSPGNVEDGDPKIGLGSDLD